MAKYMIHACPKRLWYVDRYLYASLIKQGISKKDIAIYVDVNEDGNLESCIQSFSMLPETGNTWHIQDDVILCSDFKDRTEQLESEDWIVCGFCSIYDGPHPAGRVPSIYMWYSFPCIRIPNNIALEFVKWYRSEVEHNPEYHMWVNKKKYDDNLFRIFISDYYEDRKPLNLKPNLVDNVDYLLGGSIINASRSDNIESRYFQEPNLLKELEMNINSSLTHY